MSDSPAVSARFRLSLGAFRLDCALTLPDRGFTVVSGRSGCGKTTLLRCLAGLARAEGEVRFRGEVWQDERRFLPLHRRPLAMVFQEPRLFPHRDVRGNLDYAWRRTAPADRRIGFDDAVEWLTLGPLLSHRTTQLSGGQQQRVAIARALLAGPQLLLMDEPLASLDQDSKHEILPCLEGLRSRLAMPVVYVTHSQDELVRLADRVVLMDNGRIRAEGPLNTMLTTAGLPFADRDDAASVLTGRVLAHDTAYGLSEVAVNGGELSVALSRLPVGSVTRVRILARDVSLALVKPVMSSIQNSLTGNIVSLTPDGDGTRMLVRLDVQGETLLARVTRRAADRLRLQPGQPVYAQIKAVALMD